MLHCRCSMSKLSEILISYGCEDFLLFTLFYMKPFPIAVALVVCKNLIFFFSPSTLCRKNVCSVLNNLSNLLLSSDLKNVFTKILQKRSCSQNRCSYKFPNIHKKISVLEFLFNKVTGLMASNIKKEIPMQLFSCEYHKMFENSFFL